MRSIILFELNEVPFQVLDYFTKKNIDSCLAQILPKTTQYITITEDEGHLHPWSTWPTLHRGVSNKLHHIKDIGENLTKVNQKYPAIWELLTKNDISTGLFGSLHTYPPPQNVKKYDFYIPDPFANDAYAHPQYIMPFQEFNLSMSRRSGRNVDSGIDKKAALKLAGRLPKLGVTMKTLAGLTSQLVSEKLYPWKSTRRRTYQSVIGFDIYAKLLEINKPAFSTFFSNHAASTMHRYWAATFPEDYEEFELSKDWRARYQNEIDFAMHKFDDMLKKLIRFVDKNDNYKLIVASSMGQKATKAMAIKTELSIRDLNKFIAALGLPKENWEQVSAMHPQYNIQIKESLVTPIKNGLEKINIKEKPIEFRIKQNTLLSIDLGHINLTSGDIKFNGSVIQPEEIGLENQKIQEEASGTAYHVPEGSLFIYDPRKIKAGVTDRSVIKTQTIAPSILNNFQTPIPRYMSNDLIEEI